MKDRHSWPSNNPDVYWPVEKIPNKKSFDQFYEYHGFEKIKQLDISYEPGYVKVALYMKNDSPKHASIQVSDYLWESKIGSLGIIRHDIFEIEGDYYGYVEQIYKKRINIDEKKIVNFKIFLKKLKRCI